MSTAQSVPERARADKSTDNRACTCHPDDSPPVPCPRMFALTECRTAARIAELETENERLRSLWGQAHANEPVIAALATSARPARMDEVNAHYAEFLRRHPEAEVKSEPLAPIVEDWRPIESAPMDETEVLLFGEGCVTLGRYLADCEEWHEINHHPTDHWGDELYPTHWMPLPSPPRAALKQD